MDAEMLKAWRKRWQAVAEIEREEARPASYELRWHQLNSLVEIGKELKISITPDDEEEIGRARWRRLRENRKLLLSGFSHVFNSLSFAET